MATIATALQNARTLLQSVSDAPDLDATRLLLHILEKKETAWLIAHQDNQLTPTQEVNFEQAVKERAAGKPLAYILGFTEFYGREFIVSPAVLIPRPATETLIDEALTVLPKLREKLNHPLILVDIGIGSGCIALTLALESSPDTVSHIFGIDTSSAALAVAQRNIERWNLQQRITLLEGDMLDPLKDKKIDLLVSNPPYIPSTDVQDLKSQTSPEKIGLQFEPLQALDGGPDGQHYINQLLKAKLPLIYENTEGSISTAFLNI